MEIKENYKPSYKEMFSLDIIDPLYFVPFILSISTGLSVSNWVIDNYSFSQKLVILIVPIILSLLYHYWVERLLEKYIIENFSVNKIRLSYVESNPVSEFWYKMGFIEVGGKKPYSGRKIQSFS